MIRFVRCWLFGHYPDLLQPYRHNRGIDFATCLLCGAAILKRRSGAWRRPARGQRIRWRSRQSVGADASGGDGTAAPRACRDDDGAA